MNRKEFVIRRLARKYRRAEKMRLQALEAADRAGDDKHAAYMEALAAGITHDELHREIILQNEEAEEYEAPSKVEEPPH